MKFLANVVLLWKIVLIQSKLLKMENINLKIQLLWMKL